MPRKAAPWFRHLRNGTGSWYVTIQGKQTNLFVADPADEAGAWRKFQQLIDQAVERSKSEAAGRPEPVAVLVSQYVESIAHRVNAKTCRDYAAHLRKLCALVGEQCVGQIDPGALEKRAAGEQWSDSHRANVLWTWQAFVRWAGRKDFNLTRPPKESRGAESVIPSALHARVLRETTGDFHQLLRLLWCVGCRPMEGATLTAEMIDWASGTVTRRQHKTKRHGKRRVLYLTTEALAILREQADRYPSGPLFRGQGGRQLTLQAIVTRFLRLSEKVGETVTSYRYRHTWATRALAAGIPDTHVAALLGHSSTRMVHEHYSHIHADARLLREAAERLAG